MPAEREIGRGACPLQRSQETFGGGCGTAFSDRSMALSHRANDGRKTELDHAIELKATPGKQLGRTDQGPTRQLPRTICDDFFGSNGARLVLGLGQNPKSRLNRSLLSPFLLIA